MTFYLSLIFIIFLIDYLSKKYIKSKFELNKEYKISKKFSIYHIKNTGLAYGTFKKNRKFINYILSFSLIILFFIFLKIFKNKSNSKLEKFAISMCFGGALANYIDRIKNKNVTDFIYIKYKNAPIYNLADFFIIFSVLILFLKYLISFFKKNV